MSWHGENLHIPVQVSDLDIHVAACIQATCNQFNKVALAVVKSGYIMYIEFNKEYVRQLHFLVYYRTSKQ